MPQEQQHYVPRFLLKNFTRGKKPKLFVYDKMEGRRFQTNVRNVAAEHGFYETRVPQGILTIEPGLAQLETRASRVVQELMRRKDLSALSHDDKTVLAAFVAAQLVRTKAYRSLLRDLGDLLARACRDWGAEGPDGGDPERGSESSDSCKRVAIESTAEIGPFIPHINDKVWVLFESNGRQTLFISDNPVTFHNEESHWPYGTIGLACKGIQIFLPLSSNLCLALLCPTVWDQFESAKRNLDSIDLMAPGLADLTVPEAGAFRLAHDRMKAGRPMQITENNVTMLNSLQVIYSSRFVYCGTDSFELVSTMLRNNPCLREGSWLHIGHNLRRGDTTQ